MKNRGLEVTGLAQETDFSSAAGVVSHLIVFNKGQLRLKVSAEAAKQVAEWMYGIPASSDPYADEKSQVQDRDRDTDEDERNEEDEETVDSI